jgi:hypothetical protein
MKAKPWTRLVVNTGFVPAAFENMLNANVLPELAVPSGAVTAVPPSVT